MSSAAATSRIEPLVDARSPLHATIGFAAGVMGIEPHLAMMVFIGARIVETALRENTERAIYDREEGHSLGNELSDLLFEMAGLHLGEKLRERLLEHHEPAAPAAGVGTYTLYPLRYPRGPYEPWARP